MSYLDLTHFAGVHFGSCYDIDCCLIDLYVSYPQHFCIIKYT